MRIGRTAFALGIIGLSTALGLAALIAERNYHASRSLFEPEPAALLQQHAQDTGIPDLQEVSFGAGGRLAGWYVPSRNRAAIVVAHGTNDDRASMLAELRLLSAAGFGVLAFDWPGLGRSQGEIRWDAGAQRALAAAYDWLAARSDVDPDRLGGLGFSMGGVMLARFAATDARVKALVLEGTPPSYEAYIRCHNHRWGRLSEWPARWAVRHSDLLNPALAPAALIGAFAPRPLLIIGGSADREVPEALVRELYAAAHKPKALWIVPGAGHVHYSSMVPEEYAQRLRQFYASLATHNAS
ncbi:MAG: alpha/beta fold hydrolase [Gammaproteobacteria bacterium]